MTTLTTWPAAVERALREIAADVSIISPLLLRIADEAFEMATSEPTAYPSEYLGDPLVRSLTDRLYAGYYCRRTVPSEHEKRASDMLEALSAANSSTDGWDGGWEVASRDGAGTAVLRSGSRTRLVRSENYCLESSVEPALKTVAIRRRREDVALQPDYYYAYGDALGDRYEDLVDARIYLNLSGDAAQAWTGLLTRELNLYRVPFTLKMLRHGAAYRRIDTCILYVSRRHAGFAASLIIGLAKSVGGLRRATPLFTRRIGPGIALADNPPGGTSFGLMRMRLVAEGIVSAWRDGKSTSVGRLNAIASRFRSSGIDLRRPWLNPGNVDISINPPSAGAGLRKTESATQWLEVASRIGARLVRDAIWHRDECTWIGWSIIPGSETNKPAVCTAGGDLYAGTSGIALFLAQLSGHTQDVRCRMTAMGALRHAISRSRPGYWPIGAYSGLAGILHAATIVSSTAGCEEATVFAPDLLKRLAATRAMDLEMDVIEGRAGAILVLLNVAGCSERHRKLALETARRLGREIVALAVRRNDQCSWATTLGRTSVHLLGYSHGTAGIACALQELFDETGDSELFDAANAALNHEWAGFDSERSNWPDRRNLVQRGNSEAGPRFMTAWCSGAPGTALALARRAQTKREPALERYLEAAVGTTLASLVTMQSDVEHQSFCLCHGVAGNAEVLLHIHDLVGGARLKEAALGAAEQGMRRYHANGTWPCGVREGGECPGLLLGLAGIGQFYLRLHDPSLPSVLVL